jgi:hypothetical protein
MEYRNRRAGHISVEIQQALEQATSLLQALKISGVKLRRDTDGLARANCPFPAHPFRSPSFVIKLSDPEHFRCEVCGVSGDVRAYVGGWRRPPPSSLPINTFLAAVQSQSSLIRMAGTPSTVRADCRLASDDQLNDVYGSLLCELELLDYHTAYLSGRGLSSNICIGNEYRNLPASREQRLAICERLLADGYRLEGVPGFFMIPEKAANPTLRGQWCVGGDELGRRVVKGKVQGVELQYEVGGILAPVRDSHWRITRFEILNDLPGADVPEALRALWPRRLSLLMSPDKETSGQAGIARLHHVGPPNGGGESGRTLWVTDSALRADILAAEFGVRALGVTSFNQLWGETIEAISGYHRVIIALGRDDILQTVRLCREAARRGVEAGVASWEHREAFDDEDCGLPDDYWNPEPYAKWWSWQHPDIREQVEQHLSAMPPKR